MYGKDVERMLGTICQINNEAAKQIHLLAREADHRLETIDHVHTVHGRAATGSPEGTGGTTIDILLTGRDDPPATDFRKIEEAHNGPDHFNHVSDQLTYPIAEPRGYLEDKHSHHKHEEAGIVYEREHPIEASTYTQSIIALGTAFGTTDGPKMKEIDSDNYQSIGGFNNSYGSPWTEIYDLQDKITQMEAYANDYPTLQWIGEKHSLLALIQLVYTCSVDAKWALLMYHNWIQQAYDHCYNGDDPSVTWEHFKHGKTAGNVSQVNRENVHIKKEDEGWV